MRFKSAILAAALATSLAALAGCSSGDAGGDIIQVGGGNGGGTPPPPTENEDPFPVSDVFNADTKNRLVDAALNDNGTPSASSPDLQNPLYAFSTSSPDLQDAVYALPAADPFFDAVDYIGAFPQDSDDNWTDGWTVFLNGNLAPWKPATEGTLNGAVPAADGSCPTGTTSVGSTTLPAGFSGTMDLCQLERRYATNGQTLALTNDNIYITQPGFPGTYIGNGEGNDLDPSNDVNVTLSIEPGTLILGGSQEAVIVTRGSQIQAVGTAANPIVFSSRKQFDDWRQTGDPDSGFGEWAGLALMGYGQENRCPQVAFTTCDIRAEGDIGYYGGNDDADSSGRVEYALILHAGNDIDGNGNELNLFTLFSVGSGTQLSHIQVHRGLDDGIEFFGGTASIKYAVITDADDDSLDWGQGWRGNAQFIAVRQSPQSADKIIEADNDADNNTAMPISAPTIANMTAIGFLNSQTGGAGVQLRRGTFAKIYNSIFAGPRNYCLRVETAAGGAALTNGNSVIENSIVYCPDSTEFSGSSGVTAAEVESWFNAGANNRVLNANLQANLVPNPVEGGSSAAGSLVANNYIGAFAQDTADTWASGWTVGLNGNATVWRPATAGTLAGGTPVADGTCPAGTTVLGAQDLPAAFSGQMDLCQLPRRFETDGEVISLTNDNIYALADGFPGTYLGNGERQLADGETPVSVTLRIEQGSLILGGNQEALIVTRGSTIEARGEPENPIVMTSDQQFNDWVGGSDGDAGRGEWAGLALMGFARENQCPASGVCNVRAEGDIGFYGGSNDNESSGILRYVVVQHAGNDIDGNGNELNGISFFGTGSSTRVSFVQSHKGLDDGIEFFGGTTFMDHAVITDAADDSLDWGQGWRGGAQFVVVKQASDQGERGIEADNDGDNPQAEPVSEPALANLTFVGSPTTSPDQTTQGILLRRGTGASITNSIIANFEQCFDMDDNATFTRYEENRISLENIVMSCGTNFVEE